MTDRPQPAGFWRRYAAWSLDAAIVAVPTLLLSAGAIPARVRALDAAVAPLLNLIAQRLVDMLMQGGDPLRLAHALVGEPQLQAALDAASVQIRALLAVPLLWFIGFAAIYWIGFEASRWQATPGKRALQLRATAVVDTGLGMRRAVLRHLAGALSWLTLNLGHALAAWTPHKRALHDYLAGTRVIVDVVGQASLPVWAKAWLWVQAITAVGSSVWLYLHLLGMLQSAVDSALY